MTPGKRIGVPKTNDQDVSGPRMSLTSDLLSFLSSSHATGIATRAMRDLVWSIRVRAGGNSSSDPNGCTASVRSVTTAGLPMELAVLIAVRGGSGFRILRAW